MSEKLLPFVAAWRPSSIMGSTWILGAGSATSGSTTAADIFAVWCETDSTVDSGLTANAAGGAVSATLGASELTVAEPAPAAALNAAGVTAGFLGATGAGTLVARACKPLAGAFPRLAFEGLSLHFSRSITKSCPDW